MQLKKKGKKVGKLRFKGKGWYKTFCYNQSGFKIIKTEKKRLDILRLSKIGDVPIRVHREVKGEIKQVIIKKHSSGKWFACIYVEKPKANYMVKTGRVAGLDVGVKYFLSDSEGRQIENPRFYEKSLESLRITHRNLSRKKRESKN